MNFSSCRPSDGQCSKQADLHPTLYEPNRTFDLPQRPSLTSVRLGCIKNARVRIPLVPAAGHRRTLADDIPKSGTPTPWQSASLLGSGRRGGRFKSGHPDHKIPGHTVSGDLRFAFLLCRCPILGAKRERAGLLAGWIPASSRLSSGTADTGESAARSRSDSSQRA